MSLLDNYTKANKSVAYYSGGGGGSVGPVISTSELFVSSIVSAVPGSAPTAPNGINFTGGSLISAGGGGPDIEFSGNNGTITGLSSINGSAYPPAGASANISTNTTTGGYFGVNTSISLTQAPFAVTPGKWYMASLEVSDIAFVTDPGSDSCFVLEADDGADTTYLGTYSMATLSTFRNTSLSTLGFCVSGPYEAQSTSMNINYRANSTAPSTFVVTSGRAWLQPLN